MKNKNKSILNIGHLLILPILLALVITSCENSIREDHYEQLDSRLESNIIKTLSEDNANNYSIFLGYLKSTGYYDILSNSQDYTVWAPSNEAFALVSDEVLNDEVSLKQIIGNLITDNSITTTNIVQDQNNSILVKMFNNKYVEFTTTTGVVQFGGVDIAEKDILVSNGVIHKIDQVLEVKNNIWNYLNDNETDFPELMNYFSQYNDSIFNEDESVVIATNSLGGSIYDSVFTLSNSRFDVIGDISSEEERYSFVGLNDNVYGELYDKLKGYYYQLSDQADSIKANTDAAIFSNLNFDQINTSELIDGTYITNTLGSEVAIDKSSIDEEIELSNGSLLVLNEFDLEPLKTIHKDIRYELENPRRREFGSLEDISINSVYNEAASGSFTNQITLLEEPDDTNSNNYVEVYFSNVLSANYKINIKYSNIGASQQTRVSYQFSFSYRADRNSITNFGPYLVSNTEDGIFTLTDSDGEEEIIKIFRYINNELDNPLSAKLKIFIEVSDEQTRIYDRRVGIDYVELVPVGEDEL